LEWIDNAIFKGVDLSTVAFQANQSQSQNGSRASLHNTISGQPQIPHQQHLQQQQQSHIQAAQQQMQQNNLFPPTPVATPMINSTGEEWKWLQTPSEMQLSELQPPFMEGIQKPFDPQNHGFQKVHQLSLPGPAYGGIPAPQEVITSRRSTTGSWNEGLRSSCVTPELGMNAGKGQFSPLAAQADMTRPYDKRSPSASDKDATTPTPAPASLQTATCSGTALHQAARQGHLGIVKFLVERGAQLSAVNEQGQTPLHLAAQNGQLVIVEWIISNSNFEDLMGQNGSVNAGMNDTGVNLKDYFGYTALHLAAEGGFEDVVKALVDAGASIDMQSEWTSGAFSMTNMGTIGLGVTQAAASPNAMIWR
jgi:hypothetical protein